MKPDDADNKTKKNSSVSSDLSASQSGLPDRPASQSGLPDQPASQSGQVASQSFSGLPVESHEGLAPVAVVSGPRVAEITEGRLGPVILRVALPAVRHGTRWRLQSFP